MLTGARKVAEKSAGTSGAFGDVAAKLKISIVEDHLRKASSKPIFLIFYLNDLNLSE
jgi:hypothetical protein